MRPNVKCAHIHYYSPSEVEQRYYYTTSKYQPIKVAMHISDCKACDEADSTHYDKNYRKKINNRRFVISGLLWSRWVVRGRRRHRRLT